MSQTSQILDVDGGLELSQRTDGTLELGQDGEAMAPVRGTIHQQVDDDEQDNLSTITGDQEKEDDLIKVYRTNDMVAEDSGTLFLVKHTTKEVIWPYTKFGKLDVWTDVDMEDKGTVVYRILESMGLLDKYDRIERAKFWLRYCKVVYDQLSVHKGTASDGIKKDMKKGIVDMIDLMKCKMSIVHYLMILTYTLILFHSQKRKQHY